MSKEQSNKTEASSAGIGTIFLDRDLRILKFSPAISKMFDLHKTDEGSPIDQIISYLPDSILNEDIKKAQDNGSPMQKQVETQDGTFYLQIIQPLIDTNDEIDGVAISFVDNTESKETKNIVRKKADLLNRAEKLSKTGSWTWNPGSGDLCWSHGLYNILGLDNDKASHTMAELIRYVYPDDKELFEEIIVEAERQGQFGPVECRLVDAHDETKYVSIRTTTLDIDAAPTIMASVKDITKSKKAIIELQEGHEKFKSVFESMDDTFLRTTLDGVIQLVSPSVKALLNKTPEEMIGKRISKYYVDPNQRIELLEEIEKNGFASNFEIQFKTGQGQVVDLLTNCKYYKDIDGNVVGLESLIRDVTHLKHSEKEIKEKEMLLDALLGSLPDSVYFKDADSKFIRTSKSMSNKYFKGQNLKGLSDFELFADDHAQKAFDDEQGILKTGKPILDREELETLDNDRYHWVRTTKMPLRNHEGEIVGTFGISKDITEQKLAQQQFRTIFEQAAVGIAHFNIDGNVLLANKRYCEALGYDKNEITGLNFNQIIYQEDRDQSFVDIKRLLQGEINETTTEYRYVQKDGNIIWGRVTNSLVRNSESKQAEYFIVIVQDITDIKLAQQKLQIEQKRYQSTFDHAAVGIAYVSLDGALIKFNNQYATILGYTSSELAGHSLQYITHPDELEFDQLMLNQVKASKIDHYKRETRYIGKDGKMVWVRVTASVVTNSSPDDQPYFVFVVEDINEIKSAQKQLAEAENAQRTAIINAEDRERTRIAHDLHDGLGQSIAAASMFINSLQEPIMENLSEEYIERYETCAAVINKAVHETRLISHNIMPNSLGQFGINQALTELVDNFAMLEMELEIVLESFIGTRRFDKAIELSTYRIVQEIVNNTLKHSKATKLRIELDTTDTLLTIVTTDNGVGFNQKNGNGLGLKSLSGRVEALEGNMKIRSTLGQGAEFTITVPVSPDDGNTPEEA